MNTGAPWPTAVEARVRVLKIQTKLHRWATDEPTRRFDDLYNLVCDPAFLIEGWRRVRGNRGARSAGIDGETAYYVETVRGEQAFLRELRDQLKARGFHPSAVREVMIPKPGGKSRRLGIATVRDRVVQATVKLVLEPILEADFKPCSYGFRPGRRAQDAIAEVHYLTSRSYEWVFEADISACFDEIAHTPLLARLRRRVGDKRVLGLVKAFLKAGILTEDAVERDTITGTPQGGILSPLLANLALSVLDEHFEDRPGGNGSTESVRRRRRKQGLPNYRIIRYADDFLVVVAGAEADADDVRAEVAAVLHPMGLRLAPEKTGTRHIDEGLDFLGWRIQRHKQRGSAKRFIYTYPSKKALASVKAKVRSATRGATSQPLSTLIYRLNPVLRGWTNYFRHGASSKTFGYLAAFTWRRVICWLRHKHPKGSWKQLRGRYLRRWWPVQDDVELFNPGTVNIVRYRYRGRTIPTPWSSEADGRTRSRTA